MWGKSFKVELEPKLSLGLLIVMALLSACGPSTEQRIQHEAELAIVGNNREACLKKAHWRSASHYGVLEGILGEDFRFIVLDVPGVTTMNLGEFTVAPLLIGKAAILTYQSLEEEASRLDRSYRQVGSPLSPLTANEKTLRYDRRMFTRSDVSWSLKGRASGWLSQESFYCGADMQNGRYFIVTNFRPAFPIE